MIYFYFLLNSLLGFIAPLVSKSCPTWLIPLSARVVLKKDLVSTKICLLYQMIYEAIVNEVLGGTDKLLLHFTNISWWYLGNCLIFFGSMYRLNEIKNFWVIISKGISFQSCMLL